MAGENEGQDDAQGQQQGEPNGDNVQQQNGAQGDAQGQQQGKLGDGQQGGKPNGEQPPAQKAGESDAEWKTRSRQWEDRAKENKAAATAALAERDGMAKILDQFRKALDPDGAGTNDDPTTVAEKAVAERETAAAELRMLKTERAAEKAARKAGADVDGLLDSRSFLDKLAKLDPTDASFNDDVKTAVEDAVKANPRLKADQPARPAANADMSGGGEASATGQLTRADLKSMDPKQIEKARKDGRLKNLLGG